jgi:glycine cleavage system H protein
MKELNELILPESLRYTEEHEWTKPVGEAYRIGISDFAQSQLGDIVFVELPKVGDSFKKGQQFGTVESVKAVSELYIPMGGRVLAVNKALEDAPELVNQDPYEKGWMIDVQPENPAEYEQLMTKSGYFEMIQGKK